MRQGIAGTRWGLTAIALAAIVVGGWLGAAPAEAGRMRHRSLEAEEVHLPKPTRLSFAAFLEAGPTLWSHATPRVPRHLALQVGPNGTPMASLFLDYLLYRRGLDSTRFDAHHSKIAPLLTQYLATLLPVTPFASPTPAITPTAQVSTPTPLTPPAIQRVPEPSTLLIAGLLAAGGLAARRRRAAWGDEGRVPFSEQGGSA